MLSSSSLYILLDFAKHIFNSNAFLCVELNNVPNGSKSYIPLSCLMLIVCSSHMWWHPCPLPYDHEEVSVERIEHSHRPKVKLRPVRLDVRDRLPVRGVLGDQIEHSP